MLYLISNFNVLFSTLLSKSQHNEALYIVQGIEHMPDLPVFSLNITVIILAAA